MLAGSAADDTANPLLNTCTSAQPAATPCLPLTHRSLQVVVTREQGVLWLWSAHNAVNERLMPIEAKYGHSEGSDPEHPKAVWPTVELCGSCRHKPAAGGSPRGPVMWDMEEVFLFMLRWVVWVVGGGWWMVAVIGQWLMAITHNW